MRKFSEMKPYLAAYELVKNVPDIDKYIASAKASLESFLVRSVSEPIFITPEGTPVHEFIHQIVSEKTKSPKIRLWYFVGTTEIGLMHVDIAE